MNRPPARLQSCFPPFLSSDSPSADEQRSHGSRMNSMAPAMDLDAGESCNVPPGFRFHPTDGELVGYYLRKKVASRRIDLDVIRDVDLYRIEPWDLQERCRIGNEEQREWYFFSHKDKKYPTGTRMNRATTAGFWKATGRDKAVHDDRCRLIGMRKTLVFYHGRAPNGQKTDWIMHEFRLQSEENSSSQEEGWVVCRAFKKRSGTAHQTGAADVWESSGCAAHDGGAITDPADCYRLVMAEGRRRRQLHCKQETEMINHNLSFLQTNNPPFVQLLPRLESPSLPLPERRNLLALTISGCEEEEQRGGGGGRVTDWRALDRFVASQLSQEEAFDREGAANIAVRNSFDAAALLLLQNSGSAEGSDPNELLGSGPPCDFGICMFEK